MRPTRRTRRGRSATTERPQTESGYRLAVEGFRWIKNPAAIAPVWLEQPERITALAMLTVLRLLVYSVIQCQVRLYLRTHDQQLQGNTGMPPMPTAAVLLALFFQIALAHFWGDGQAVAQLSGLQPYHLLVCDALGLDASWYTVPSVQKCGRYNRGPSNVGCQSTRETFSGLDISHLM